jgi:tRNA-2-methylthio-N6-dimethylallyladenosine synthase
MICTQEMKRGYSREKYLDMIHMIRHYMPDASISADAIVGFPGELPSLYLSCTRLLSVEDYDSEGD